MATAIITDYSMVMLISLIQNPGIKKFYENYFQNKLNLQLKIMKHKPDILQAAKVVHFLCLIIESEECADLFSYLKRGYVFL
jgi:hypothetical protein